MRKAEKGNSKYSAEGAARGDIAKALRVLKRAGIGQHPWQGTNCPWTNEVAPPKRKLSILAVRSTSSCDLQRLIQITYGGHVRVLEPHDYGIQKGTLRLLAFQIRGGSLHAKGGRYGWKLLSLSKIEACTVLDDDFPGSRARSTQEHLVWDQLFARVE